VRFLHRRLLGLPSPLPPLQAKTLADIAAVVPVEPVVLAALRVDFAEEASLEALLLKCCGEALLIA
jgi:hypothetical protein